jgi:hypothetical protein
MRKIFDLLLKQPDATFKTYLLRQMKHLTHASEALTKIPRRHFKTIAKHTQHSDKTHATYV